jgi:hypothetical protein
MCSKHQQELMTESNPIDRIVRHSDKSHKKERQEKTSPIGSIPSILVAASAPFV